MNRYIDAHELCLDLWNISDDSMRTLFMAYVNNQPTVEAIPVSFIEKEMDRMTLYYQIAISEGEYEIAGKWVTRQAALQTIITRWKLTEVEVEE